MILVFKEFLQTSIPLLISVLYAKRNHCFPLRNFRLTVLKSFAEEPVCFGKFRVTKNFTPKKGKSRFSIENLLSHSTESFRRRTFRSMKKFRASQIFMHKKRISLNSVKNFLSHSADKFRKRTLLCFGKKRLEEFQIKEGGGFTVLSKFLLSHRNEETSPCNHSVFQKTSGRETFFMDKGGGYHDFQTKFWCLTVPKTCVRVSYCFWENFWFQKFLWMRREVSRFSVESCWSHSAKKIRVHPFNVSETLAYRKLLLTIGAITISVKYFLSHSAEKLRIGTFCCFTSFGYQKLLWINCKMVICWQRQIFRPITNFLSTFANG